MPPQKNELDQIWHNDGHKIKLNINKSELVVIDVECPNFELPETACKDSKGGCVVQWFAYRFGMECNVGTCPAAETIDISWTMMGSKEDLDQAQVWFIPMSDDVFRAWVTSYGKE